MSRALVLERGSPGRLGAHAENGGINFAVRAPSAGRIEVCVFDATGTTESQRLALPARTGDVWHGFLPDTNPGLVYGYRAHGTYAPESGHRFNPNKLLIDPYTRALVGPFAWHDAVFGYDNSDPAQDLSFDTRDSAPCVPKCRVVEPFALRERPARPHIPWTDTILYEMHVRGFTHRHPQIPERLRGKIAALAQPIVIDYLRGLGVTTIELLPVAAFLDERALVRRGLSNYWGYNPIAFFAAHRPYLSGEDATEFAHVIDRLHLAGIEVILDVVFNHTAEGDEYGPTLSFRGLDNRTYYRIDDDQPRRYRDFSGCGNTLDCTQPAVIALIHDALRYWAVEIGIDGFRFDLATALGRDASGKFDACAPIWQTLLADPGIAGLKLIAEPWDAAVSTNQRGHFLPPFAEWNDHYRDGVRRFWRGDEGTLAEFATRFAGSSDVFGSRSPTAGINFIASHDGFTLADLVSYRDKHNEANGEANHDGVNNNLSSNAGIEGPTSDVQILAERRRRTRSMLATLLLSRGVPMLLAGDELSRTQFGNNNAYCQDNETSWLDWTALHDAGRNRTRFLRQLTELRRQLGVLRQDCFWTGETHALSGIKDISWLNPDGSEAQLADWHDPSRRVLGIWLAEHSGNAIDSQIYLALNADTSDVAMRLPPLPGSEWLCVLDSDDDDAPRTLHPGHSFISVRTGCLCAFVPRMTPVLGIPRDWLARAEQAGVQAEYEDNASRRRLAPFDTLVRLLAHLHPLEPTATVPPAPAQRCWMHPDLQGTSRRWILSLQWYGLHSARSWGIGDFADIGRFAEIAAVAGAAGVMLSPLHAPSLRAPEKASPYSPSSRFALNPLLISLPELGDDERSQAYSEFLALPETQVALERVRAAAYVDHPEVMRLKLEALRVIYREFRKRHLDGTISNRGEQFRRFQKERHAVLRPYAVFEALLAQFGRDRSTWPLAYREYDARAAEGYVREHEHDVEFYEYLQWSASCQWDRAIARARAAGLEIGFITDLALGADVDGAETWQWPDLIVREMEVGAPPDAFAPHGQAWGLPPWHPQRLVDLQYQPFVELLNVVTYGAGAVRIDHVMGLMRQFWLPRGERPEHGAYVRYPFDALLRLLTRISTERQCMIIGEDLGNVPQTLRERLAEAGVVGYRLAYFERDPNGAFTSPQHYARDTVTALTTHDLPTLLGFCAGADITERESLGMDAARVSVARSERESTCAAFVGALRDYGYTRDTASFTDAAHRFLAASNSCLAIVQIEDVVGMYRQANLPGTADHAPNWRQHLPLALEDLADDKRMRKIADIFSGRRRGA